MGTDTDVPDCLQLHATSPKLPHARSLKPRDATNVCIWKKPVDSETKAPRSSWCG
ncbi:hypothetical protein RSSM_03331 [Rhodopirellula sallentina SM41]|uniref:Uncharacterized protein n=1 Tax=Rhodopirellula sallentina SM41 TaxID=1263870 RepID=M5U1Q5_9BACT|nr:hypothetical protein RSSM_03331 [Rhodopirellula sallentina SM41]